MGVDNLRRRAGVFDVVQAPVFGKKGRVMVHVRLLARPADLSGVIDACFEETTTTGVRYHIVQRAALPRVVAEVDVGAERVRVKAVERPGGRTAKAEVDDVLAAPSHAERARLRERAAHAALDAGAESDR